MSGGAGPPPGDGAAAGDPPPAAHANVSNRQLARNFAAGYLGIVVSVVSGLVVVPVLLRSFGQAQYGLYVVMLSVGVFLGVFDAGVGTATVQQAARAMARGDVERRADIFATSRRFFLASGALAVVGTAVLVPFVDRIFNVDPADVEVARIAIVVTGLTAAVNFLLSVPNCALFAAGRSDRGTSLLVLTSLLTAGAQITVALAGGGVVGVLVVLLLGAATSLVVLTVSARRLGVLGMGGTYRRPVLTELLVLGWRNLVISLGGAVSYRYDVAVIGIVLPVKDVAPYALALNTANFTRTLSTAGTNLLIPSYAHSDAVDDRERQFRLFSSAVLFSMALTGPAVICFAAFGQELLRLWLGTVPEQTWLVMVVLNLMMLLQLPGHQAGILLTGIARTKLLARIAIPVAVVNLGLSIAFTAWLGPVGPVLGSLPQAVLLEFVALPLYSCRSLGIPYARYLREALLPLLPALAAAGLVALGLDAGLGRMGWWSVPECVGVFAAAWLVLGAILWRREPRLREAAHRIVGRGMKEGGAG